MEDVLPVTSRNRISFYSYLYLTVYNLGFEVKVEGEEDKDGVD